MAFSCEMIMQGAEEQLATILMTGLCTALALLPIIVGGTKPGHEMRSHRGLAKSAELHGKRNPRRGESNVTRALLACVTLSTVIVGTGGAVPVLAQETPSPSPAPPLIPGPKPARVRPDDKRRTLRSYGSNLRYNFIGVLTRGNHKPLLITAALTAPSFLLDDEGKKYFTDHPHNDFGKIGASLGGSVAVVGLTVGVFSAGRISRGDRFRATSYDLSQAIIVTQAYTQALKFAVGRERPDKSNNVSFPSGHASNAFTAATVIARHYPRLTIPGYGAATYVAVSRMAANKHHLSDIVAGSGLGWGIGRAVVRRNGRPPDVQPGKTGEPPQGPTTWHIAPWGGPAGDGRGLAVAVSF